jgi:hypothetical protein
VRVRLGEFSALVSSMTFDTDGMVTSFGSVTTVRETIEAEWRAECGTLGEGVR